MENSQTMEGFINTYKLERGFGFFEDGTYFHINDILNPYEYGQLDTYTWRYRAAYEKLPSTRKPGGYVAVKVTILGKEPKKTKFAPDAFPEIDEKNAASESILMEPKDDELNEEAQNNHNDMIEGHIKFYLENQGYGFFEDDTYFIYENIQNAADLFLDTRNFTYKATFTKIPSQKKAGGFEARNITILSKEPRETPVTGSFFKKDRLTKEDEAVIFDLLKTWFKDGETVSLVDIGNLFSRNAIYSRVYGFNKLVDLCRHLPYMDVENRSVAGGGTQAYATFHWDKKAGEPQGESSNVQNNRDTGALDEDERARKINAQRDYTDIDNRVTLAHLHSGEEEIIRAFSDVFFVSYGVQRMQSPNGNYRYGFLRPSGKFCEQFNLDKELVLVFSTDDKFEPRSFEAVEAVHKQYSVKSPFRLERICSLIVSKDIDVTKKVKDHLKTISDKQYVIIPFSYEEIIRKHRESTLEKWMEFVVQRFRDFFYDRDLFSMQAPITNELYFFGRQSFVQELVNRHKSFENSGVFGLRRSGKTSVLYAMQRALNTIGKKWIWLDGQTLQHMRWNHALHYILTKAYEKFGVEYKVERGSYDFENAAIRFEQDLVVLKQSMLGESLLLMIDEIEWITFGIASQEHWKEGGDFTFFWNAIKAYFHSHRESFSFVVAGTNPRAIETAKVNSSDNPLYGQVAVKYMPSFDGEETKDMINKLGGYMGLRFDDWVCEALTVDYGGQPFVIRQFCSKVNQYIARIGLEKPITITNTIYDVVKEEFDGSGELYSYCQLILDVLIEKYPEEYEMLKQVALDGKNMLPEQLGNRAASSHLVAFGIIETIGGKMAGFKNEVLKNYLCDEHRYERKLHTPEERSYEVRERWYNAEVKLQKMIRRTLLSMLGEEKASKAFRKEMAFLNGKNPQWNDLSYSELFSKKCIKSLTGFKNVVLNNWDYFKNQMPSAHDFKMVMDPIIRARNDGGAHTNIESPMDESDFEQFRNAMRQLEGWLEAIE